MAPADLAALGRLLDALRGGMTLEVGRAPIVDERHGWEVSVWPGGDGPALVVARSLSLAEAAEECLTAIRSSERSP